MESIIATRTLEIFSTTGRGTVVLSVAQYGETVEAESVNVTEVVGLPGIYRGTTTSSTTGFHYAIDLAEGTRWHFALLNVTDTYYGSQQPLTPNLLNTTGAVAIDWAKVVNQTSTVGLSGTTVGVVSLATTLTTYTGNTPQTGDSFARIGATGSGLTSLASQSSVDDLPTNAELAAALAGADDAVLAAVAALNNLSMSQVATLLTALEANLALDHGAGSWATATGFSTVNADNTSITAIKAKTDQLMFTIPNQVDANSLSGGGTGLTAAETRAALGMASADLDDQLDTILASTNPSGSGPFTFLVTVLDDDTSDTIENASVRIYRTGELALGETDVDGLLLLGVNAATFTLVVVAAGYSGSSQTVVVAGDDSLTVRLTPLGIILSEPSFVTGYLVARVNGVVTAGIPHTLVTRDIPDGVSGESLGESVTVESDGDGLVEFVGLLPGVGYDLTRGSGEPVRITAYDAGGGVFPLLDVWG